MVPSSFKQFAEQKLGRFPLFVIYAILEWGLILLLFVDGFLAFVANEFARFFEMPVPCLLCTRIDHILIRRNPGFYYNDSLCESHKKDVSFLAYCHVHRKLSNVRSMCEQCLLSFATEKDSDCDTYKSLVGFLHKDLESFVEHDDKVNMKLQKGKKDGAMQVEKCSIECCSCCGVPLKIGSSSGKAVPKGSAIHLQAPTSTPRAPFVMLKKEEKDVLELSHLQLSNLKIMSDDVARDTSTAASSAKVDAKATAVALLAESEYLIDEAYKTPKYLKDEACKTPKCLKDEACNTPMYLNGLSRTPSFQRGSKFFGIPLTDSATSSPRWPTKLQRKSPLEKSELASESTEENPLNEIDADSILHRLKRQARLDRKSLIDLYMELDEERSASAIAANNAMAMITRLQTEKAAVQMEALQYQRMMEEQAEYDQEALQVLKDLLAKKEEEVKELEAELEAYRATYGCGGKESVDDSENHGGSSCHELTSQYSFSEKSKSSSPPYFNGSSEANEQNSYKAETSLREQNGRGAFIESISDSDDERTFTLDTLEDMQKKTLSTDEVHCLQSSSDERTHMEEAKELLGKRTQNLQRLSS